MYVFLVLLFNLFSFRKTDYFLLLVEPFHHKFRLEFQFRFTNALSLRTLLQLLLELLVQVRKVLLLLLLAHKKYLGQLRIVLVKLILHLQRHRSEIIFQIEFFIIFQLRLFLVVFLYCFFLVQRVAVSI